MQIPILNGIYADNTGEFRSSYPRNLMPVPKSQGISKGYLKPADGIAEFANGPGTDRGGINWNGVCYRVLGSKFVKIASDGGIQVIGDVGGNLSPCKFDYSFDRLGICSGGNLYYSSGSDLNKVTDSDLGTVLDFIQIDSYFMTTDGNSLVVTELNDPFSVNPLKYGSAEADPDPIKAVLKVRDEACAIGRYTIETFYNVGGSLFPFQRIPGAQIMRGAIGTQCACNFVLNDKNGIAFLGGGRNEPPAVWFGLNGACIAVSTREIETILREYSEFELSKAVLETRTDKSQNLLYVHLPDQTLVYDSAASLVLNEPVWFVLTSSTVGKGTYRARHFVWCYDKWICGDPTSTKIGYLTDASSHHYGETNGWEFGTTIVYNEAEGVIFHELELISLFGNIEVGKNPVIWTSYSTDGVTWSVERPRTAGRQGKRDTRLNWLQQGNMKNWRIQKFRGTSDAHISFARLEARLEQLKN